MDVVKVVFVLEVDGRDRMKFGMEYVEENIDDILDLSHNILSNLVSKIVFGVQMAKVVKERVGSNYFEMDVHNLEIVN